MGRENNRFTKVPVVRRPKNITPLEKIVVWDELVRLRLRGESIEKCAKQLGYQPSTIHRWTNHPEFKVKYEKSKEQLKLDLAKALTDGEDIPKNIEDVKQKYSFTGLQKIHALMTTSDDEKIQLRAAMDLADRGKDTSKVKKVQQQTWHAALTPELLVQMAETAKELQQFGRIIPAASTAGVLENEEDEDELVVGDADGDGGLTGDREDGE